MGAVMDDESQYRAAVKQGLRRAGLHWVRASYEVVAGIGALLDEIASARKSDAASEPDDPADEGPVRIEID